MNIKASSSLTVLVASLAFGDSSPIGRVVFMLFCRDFSSLNRNFCNEFIALVFGVTKDTAINLLLDVLNLYILKI